MYNCTYNTTSYILSTLPSEEDRKKESKKKSTEPREKDTLIDLGHIYSIELRRNEIKMKLAEYFEPEEDNDVLDFLATNNDVLQTLPFIAKYIWTHTNSVSKLVINLLNESETWKTLFITVYSKSTWEETNSMFEDIFYFLYESRPTVFEKVNFSFCKT